MSIASRLSLAHLIPIIASANSLRQYEDERHNLKMVIKMWKVERPESYNLKELNTVLAQEVRLGKMKELISSSLLQGLHDMVMWINLMTQESP